MTTETDVQPRLDHVHLAVEFLRNHRGPVPACRHVRRSSRPDLCARHPNVGLVCRACYGAHASQHHLRPYLCDSCGQRPGDVWVRAIPVITGEGIRPDGQTIEVDRTVTIRGVAWCLSCMNDAPTHISSGVRQA